MKTDKLEQFILDNKKEFGSTEPTPDVWERINKRKPIKKGLEFNWKLVMSRAAAVVAIFVASYYFHEYRSSIKGENTDANLAQVETEPIYLELQEAENYYISQIQFKKQELFGLTEESPTLQKDINTDLSELDIILLELKADLKENADNQEVIEAMIQNYMLKLEILEDMLNQIKPKNNQKNTDETSYSI